MSFLKPIRDPGDATARPSSRLWGAKYAVEWVLALVLAAALLPLGLLVALLVKVTSRGPVFYVAERLGRNDRPFRLLKFRSMKVGVPEVRAASGKIITAAGDARLTSIGAILRLGFDELPQLLNVLRGDMCLIGPRPDVVWQLDLYWPREKLRTFALPGITGLTQVMGGRELDNHQNYELDVRYVVRSNAWMDLWIALLTPAYALGAKKIGQRFFRRHMEGMEAFSDATVAAAGAGNTQA
jgi:undecaprenyl phosphate N,N'-diacetylbacillosamine 1-phosphate transferase